MSASSENELFQHQSDLKQAYPNTMSQQNWRENVLAALAMITSEKANDICLGFNTFHMTKIRTSDILTRAKCFSMVIM